MPRKPHRAATDPATHPKKPRPHQRLGDGRSLHLIFDADDTLWDSNVHFLEAEARFIAELVAAGVGETVAVRAAIRRANSKLSRATAMGVSHSWC